jgi:hypothetical protein
MTFGTALVFAIENLEVFHMQELPTRNR